VRIKSQQAESDLDLPDPVSLTFELYYVTFILQIFKTVSAHRAATLRQEPG